MKRACLQVLYGVRRIARNHAVPHNAVHASLRHTVDGFAPEVSDASLVLERLMALACTIIVEEGEG